MVHALLEAHRVHKPDGLLLDLRPAAVHRRVGLLVDDEYQFKWAMREKFDDDHAADRAVAEVTHDGHFKPQGLTRLPCYRVMDTVDEFKEWLDDFISRDKCDPHEWLVSRVEEALHAVPARTKIVVSAPLVLRVAKKK